MPLLDLDPQSQRDTDAYARGRMAPDFPATFGDTFATSWDEGRLVSSSVAHGNAQLAAFDDWLDEVRQRSGQDIRHDALSSTDMIGAANQALDRIKQKNPDIDIAPIDMDELNRRAVAKSRIALSAYDAMAGREKTFGGRLGTVLGGLASSAADPLNVVALAAAPAEGLSVLSTALRWGGIAGASQAAVEAVGAPYHEQVQPGYGASGAPAANIVGAAVTGGVLGGAFKTLGNAWTRFKTGAWPRSVRDAGNVVESEANVQQSNVLPGIDGEVAHREALSTAVGDVAAQRPVAAPDQQLDSLFATHEAKIDALSTSAAEKDV